MSFFKKLFGNQNNDLNKIDLSKVKLTTERFQLLSEIVQIEFEPNIKLEKAKRILQFVTIEKSEEGRTLNSTVYKNTKIFFETAQLVRYIDKKEVPAGEHIVNMKIDEITPSIAMMFDQFTAPRPSPFEQSSLFELAAKLAVDNQCEIFRDDLGLERVKILPEELLKFSKSFNV